MGVDRTEPLLIEQGTDEPLVVEDMADDAHVETSGGEWWRGIGPLSWEYAGIVGLFLIGHLCRFLCSVVALEWLLRLSTRNI